MSPLLNMAVKMSSESGGAELVPRSMDFFGIEITETMVATMIVTVSLIIFALCVRIFCIPKWEKNPRHVSGLRMFLEYLVEMFDGTGHDKVGHNTKFIAPWYFACSAMICLGTLIELFGIRPAVADLNMTLALGFSTFILMIAFGIKEKKARLLKRYMIAIPILTDAVVPFSMALRIFGSVFSGYLIMHMIYTIPFPIIYPILGSLMFTAFHALIQSFVFMTLSMSFIQETSE